MSGGFAIGGDSGPVVSEDVDCFRAEVDHGFDGEHHAGFEAGADFLVVEIGHFRFLVQLAAHAMSDEIAHHGVAVARDEFLDAATEVAQHFPGLGEGDGVEE